MEMHSVESSNVAQIGHDTSSRTLRILFHSGGTYQYFNVPNDVFDNFLRADSKGKYFHENIKDIYEYSKY